MAFTFCENCGEKIDIANTKCPYCGFVRGGDTDPHEQEHSGRRVSSDGDLWRTPSEGERGEYIPPYAQPPRRNPYAPPRPHSRPAVRRPVSVGMIVFSAINMFFGLFCIIGLVFGSLALAQTIGAHRARTDEEEVNKKKTALVLNIIGAVLTVVNIAAFIVGFIYAADALAAMTVFML